jgi:membrane-bound lytic murein transglycosylase D
MEERWQNVLYASDLFAALKDSITNQSFEAVYYPDLPTDTLKKRLAILDAKTPFNIEYNPVLENVIKAHLKSRKRSTETLIQLSHYYFPRFEEVLDKHNLPLEIKYLAVVESSLKPRAKSRVGATGLWQFMFSTGKMFGLNVNSYVDDRSDPLKATQAACKYLQALYKRLGDWDLALAAYNSGPGNVSKAIRRSGGRINYWNIRQHLPRETAGYVPAFLATMYIFEYSKQHGFNSDGPRIPYIATDTIHIKKQIALEHVAHLTDIDLAEVAFLNPQYKLGIIPVVKNQTYTLRLPIDKVGVFVANQDTIYAYAQQAFNKREKPLPELNDLDKKIYYKVQSGDYLGKIANRFGVRISQIKRWNSLKNNNLKVGKRLVIFPRKTPSVATKKQPSKGQNTKTYIVKQGDSLWSIAQQYPGVSVADIKKKNDLKSAKLNPGIELKIL